MDSDRLMLAALAISGVGCSRNWRTQSMARSRSLRAAGYAGVSRPITMPLTAGSTPDLKNAAHAARPSPAYTAPCRRPTALARKTAASAASPASSAGTSTWWL